MSFGGSHPANYVFVVPGIRNAPVIPTPAKDTFSFFSAIYRVRVRVRVSRVSRVGRVSRV